MVIPLTTPSIIYVVFRQHRVILGCLLLSIMLTIGYCLVATPLYQAETSLVVNFTRDPSSTPGGHGASEQTPGDHEQIINSYVLMLQGSDLAQQVIGEVGLETLYPKIASDADSVQSPMERAVDRFLTKDVQVRVEKDSNVIDITLLNHSRAGAIHATEVLVNRFIEREAKIGRDPRLEFVQGQVDFYRKQVTDAQTAMRDFQLRNKISSMDEERTFLLQQRSDLEERLSAVQARVVEGTNKQAVLERQIAGLHEVVQLKVEDRDPTLEAARGNLAELKLREQKLLTNFRDDSEVVLDLRTQMLTLTQHIESYEGRTPLVRTEPNTAFEQIQVALIQARADLAAATESERTLSSQVEQLGARLAERDRQQPAFQDLERQYQIADQNYRTYLQGVQEARIADDLNNRKITSIAMFDSPDAPALPKYPRTALIVALGVFAGLVFGFGTAFLLEALDEKLNTPWQVANMLELPLLGSMALLRNRDLTT
jgi:uncharacterized protein involved in exopolysaccharide biosynthesis